MRDRAYVCPDPETFLEHVAESGSRKKYWFSEGRNGKTRVWMVLEGVEPIILGFKDFEGEEELQRFTAKRLKDFVHLAPLSLVIDQIA